MRMTSCRLLAGVIGLTLAAAICPSEEPIDDYVPNTAVCGNDRAQSGEKCDGTDVNDRDCVELGFGSGVLACKPNCRDFDRAGCGAPTTCGNGVVEDVELCDGNDLDNKNCEDLGRGPGLLSCLANCADFDTSLCSPPLTCGDGDVDKPDEMCDGTDFYGLTCERLGYAAGQLICAADCLSIDHSQCSATCQPDCSSRVCGPDPVCGESCGQCDGGACVNGQCRANVEGGPSCPADKDCNGRVCGPDPVCGLSCGTCSSGSCNGSGQCSGPTTCTAGTLRCSTDNYGFQGCGFNNSTATTEYGQRVPCSASQSCSNGHCNRSGCLGSEIIVLLDRSSSMLTNNTWTWVKDGLVAALFLRDDTNSFGFREFPSGDGCSVGYLTSMALNNADNIYGQISDPSTGASTPISDAIDGLTGVYGDPNDGQAVILISDGDQTTTCGTATDAIQRASELLFTGVKVYTVAVTTTANRTVLDQIAAAGGTGTARLVTNSQGMYDALTAIFTDLGSCQDCTEGNPACSGNNITYCDGDQMSTIDCTSYGWACGNFNSTLGDRCLVGASEQCSTDTTRGINVCDPRLNLNCVETDPGYGVCRGRDGGSGVDSGGSTGCVYQDLGSATGSAIATGNTSSLANSDTASCGGDGPDRSYAWRAPSSATYTFSLTGSSYDTVLYLRDACGGSELACNDEYSSYSWSQLTHALTTNQQIIVVVDSYASGGAFSLTIN